MPRYKQVKGWNEYSKELKKAEAAKKRKKKKEVVKEETPETTE